MICPNCGKEYNERMTCCISCGADLVPNDEVEQVEKADEESLIPKVVPEPVYAMPCSYASFESGEITVPLKRRSSSTAAVTLLKIAGSFLTAVLMLALILTSASAVGIRLLTDEEKIEQFAERLDVMALPAAQFSQGAPSTVQEAVYAMSEGTGLTRDNIRAIYDRSTAKAFLAAQLVGYADYIRNGAVPEQLTTEQLKDVFEENVPLISDTMGYPLNERDIELACSEIDRAKPLLELLSCENMERTVGRNTLVAVRVFGSVPTIAVTAALALAMVAVFRGINKKSTKALNWGGGTILAGGAIVLAATFLFTAQLPYSNADRFVQSVLKCACDVISPDMYSIGAVLAVVGGIMLVWSESLRKAE